MKDSKNSEIQDLKEALEAHADALSILKNRMLIGILIGIPSILAVSSGKLEKELALGVSLILGLVLLLNTYRFIISVRYLKSFTEYFKDQEKEQ